MDIELARFNMIEQQIRTWEVLDPAVLALLSAVKREAFVPDASRPLAFMDLEIPLAHGQVMLQPKLEARLLQEARIRKTDRVLEIGTGTGYMTALLAACAREVVSVDLYADFTEAARARLAAAGVSNVSLATGDAARGWGDGPWDVIVVTASLPVLPDAMVNSLARDGRLVAVVGDPPVMRAERVTCVAPGDCQVEELFDICVPPLVNAVQPERFVF